jgi:hypothetical protein
MEGVTINAKDNKVYVAMSYVEKAMEEDVKKAEPVDHIKVKKITAGVVYEMDMIGGQKDQSGYAINSEFVSSNMKGVVVGEDLAKADWKGNTAADDKMANPDNLSYSEELRTLFIGEDSGMHANNYLWAYNVDTKKLSRILTVPAGAEATGLQMVENMNGYSYIMSNFQHAGDAMLLPDTLKAQVEPLVNQLWDNKRAGSVGYVSGIPTAKQMLEWKDSDKSLIGLRDLSEAKGAVVKWNEQDRSVTITKGGKNLTIKVGESMAMVNGQSVQLPNSAKIENEKTMFPTSILNDFLK